MKIEVALANTINAKNSMQNHLGFTPIQVVTGTLPKIPSVLNSDLPALEEADSNVENKHLMPCMWLEQPLSKLNHVKRSSRH